MSIADKLVTRDTVHRRARRDEVRIVDLVVLAWRVVTHWSDRARQRRMLAELDDRLLEDAGITRRQVAQEIRKPFWR
jgi:uncharacterized protein YjiS (DUF1127 family)